MSGAAGSSPARKNASSDPAVVQHVPEDRQQRGHVPPAHPAVHQRQQRRGILGGIEAPHERRGRLPHRCKHGPHRRHDARDPAERQARGDEAGDLAIRRIGVDADALDGVFDGAAAPVLSVERLEWFAQRGATGGYRG